MSCPAQALIGETLTFSICTHNANSAWLEDADEEPLFRIYEDQSNEALIVGNMEKVDDESTTGFYRQTILCSADNGFESGKTYTIYIEAKVSGDTGGISYGFRAISEEEYWQNLIIAIRHMMRDIEVRPKTTALGPCDKPTRAIPTQKERQVKKIPPKKTC